MKSLETTIAELNEKIVALTTENTQLKESATNANKAAAQVKLTQLCTEAGLPEIATKRLQASFKESVNTDGMQEAVNSEKKYIESLTAGKITRNNGAAASEPGQLSEADLQKKQDAAWAAMGISEAERKQMTK